MADMDCPNCEPQSAGSANSARCVAGPRTEIKYFARSAECAGKATLSYTQTDQCVRSGVSIVDENGVVLTQAQYDAIVEIPQPSIAFKCGGAAAPAVAEVHMIPATVSIGGIPVLGIGPELQTFDLPAYPVPVAEVHVTPATIFVGGVAVVGTGPELQRFDLPAIPVAKTLCEMTQDAATSIAVSAAQPTDEIVVKRGATCARIPLAALLTDVQISAISRMDWNPATGLMTLDITESNGDVNTVSFTITVPSETALTATGSQVIKVTQSGASGHTIAFDLILDPVAGNLLSVGPAGLSAKNTCPPTATVATKLCKTDEFVGFNPSTCLPEKFTVGRSNHSYAECLPAADLLITGPELDAAFAPAPVGVVTYAQDFNATDSDGAGVSAGTVPTPFPVASALVSLAANQAMVISLTTAKENAIGDSATITASGAGTITQISNQLFWRSSGTFVAEVRHKVFVFTPTAAGNFVFTANGTYSSPDNFRGAVRMSGVKVTSPNASPPSLAGSLAWIGNAGDPADPGGAAAQYGTGLGPQTLTVTGAPAGQPSLWIQTGRHLQVNSADWSGGGTQISDVGGADSFSCTLSHSNATSPTNSITLTTHVNVGGVADDRLGFNVPAIKDVATGLIFVPSVAGNGGGSGSSTYTIANVCNASVVNINDCPSAYTTVDVSLGTVSGLLDAGQGYDVSIVTGTGRVLGPVSLVNFGTTPRNISVPLPSGHWTNNSALASGATDAVTISYKISGNTHASGKTGAVLKITPPLTTIEVKHV